MENKIKERVARAIEEKVFPGCVVGVLRKEGKKVVLPFGNFTYDLGSPEITENSIFDVASITKAIPTASLALKLIDEGKLKLEDKLIKFIPEFKNSNREKVLVKHLLTYTLKWDFHLSGFKNEPADKILERILMANLKGEPGRELHYANATSILLGLVIERVFGSKLDEVADHYFFRPLGMNRTSFSPLKRFKKEEIVPTEVDDWRGLVQGKIHDESAYVFMESGKAVGSAGLFSTAPDLLNFLLMLLNDGELIGQRYFSPEVIKLIHTNQLEKFGKSVGLGWELYQPYYMGRYATKETFGKTGFTGCVVMADIEKEAGIVILSNVTYPKRRPREEQVDLINSVRRDIADIVFSNFH